MPRGFLSMSSSTSVLSANMTGSKGTPSARYESCGKGGSGQGHGSKGTRRRSAHRANNGLPSTPPPLPREVA